MIHEQISVQTNVYLYTSLHYDVEIKKSITLKL